MTAHAQSRGFTLIELIVALAIVALLLLLGMPSFNTFVRNSEIRSTAESIINGLRVASTQAANLNRPVTFSLKGGAGVSWTGWDVTYVDEDGNPQMVQQYSRKEAGSSTKVDSGGQFSVSFSGVGRVVNQGILPNDHIQLIDIASVVSGEARPLRIIVDDPLPGSKRGLRMCDPALAALTDPRACS